MKGGHVPLRKGPTAIVGRFTTLFPSFTPILLYKWGKGNTQTCLSEPIRQWLTTELTLGAPQSVAILRQVTRGSQTQSSCGSNSSCCSRCHSAILAWAATDLTNTFISIPVLKDQEKQFSCSSTSRAIRILQTCATTQFMEIWSFVFPTRHQNSLTMLMALCWLGQVSRREQPLWTYW